MKIISKFKDYYDSAAGFGIDDTIMYVRTQKEIVLRTSLLSIPKVNHENSFGGYRVRPAFKSFFGEPIKYEGSFYLTGCLIGIAGQIFVCLKVTYRQDERKYKYLHSIAGFNEIFEKTKDRHFFYHEKFSAENFFAYLLTSLKQMDIFQLYKVPVFVIRLSHNTPPLLTLNDELKALEFYKVVDPFTAFNNISGFISGVLGSKEHEMVHINDKDMLVAKGFDQWSFRTMKSKKS
jgi:hypothetical protein